MVLLVRHAAHSGPGHRLIGRLPGYGLSDLGRRQARALGDRLGGEGVDAVVAGPLERAQETARSVAEACGSLAVETAEALDEVNFGSWSGQDFETLSGCPAWRKWNAQRDLARTPAGESMPEVQNRILEYVRAIAAVRPSGVAVLVSHAEVIRAALLHCLGLPLDAWSRLETAPASISRIMVGGGGMTVAGINEVVT
jgi:broad specificity phosphatase PhoE